MADGSHSIPSREDMVTMLWCEAQKPETSPSGKSKLCRTIANLMGYNRAPDYADLEAEIKRLEAEAIDAPPEAPWWEQTDSTEQ